MFRAKEMVNSSHQKMKEEEGRRIMGFPLKPQKAPFYGGRFIPSP